MAQGIALSLEFKLGSEVLRTVITREQNEREQQQKQLQDEEA